MTTERALCSVVIGYILPFLGEFGYGVAWASRTLACMAPVSQKLRAKGTKRDVMRYVMGNWQVLLTKRRACLPWREIR